MRAEGELVENETTAAAADARDTPAPTLTARRWPAIRWTCVLIYFAAAIGYCVEEGVPASWPKICTALVVGLLLTRIGQPWRQTLRVLLDWLPFLGVLVIYNQSRGLANQVGMPLHEADIAHAEEWLFGGTEPTVWLQHHLYNPAHVYWYDALCTLVYTSHFLATPILAAVLWLRDRAQWVRYISRVILLSVAGLITFVLFPEAPPWYAAKDGVIAPVARLSGRGWIWLHAANLDTLLSQAQSTGSNAVAAMPSLHTAFATLVAIFVGSRLRTRWRYLLALYPLAMGFALVYTGEHYVLDLAAGVVYALAAHWAMNWWERRRRQRPDRTLADVQIVNSGTIVSGGATGAGGT